MMDVDPGAALWQSQAVEPYMRQRGSGAIVHLPALPETDPTAGMAAYSLSKAALTPRRTRQRCSHASLRRLARPHHTLPPPLHLTRS
jgi:NAD(P)-dependent dehydrogenase (short-subunit alcohol dehydrogenase family)